MKTQKLCTGFVATIVVFALGAPAIASAEDANDIQGKAVKVSYSDLNLKKQEGAKVLYQRLQQASKRACDMDRARDERSPKQLLAARRCYSIALSSAVAEIDNEFLTQIHNN